MLQKADPNNSTLVEHILSTEHKVNWSSAGIVFKEPKWKERNILEAVCMSVDTGCISQPSASVHKMFVPVVEQEVKEKINNARMIYSLLPHC